MFLLGHLLAIVVVTALVAAGFNRLWPDASLRRLTLASALPVPLFTGCMFLTGAWRLSSEADYEGLTHALAPIAGAIIVGFQFLIALVVASLTLQRLRMS